MTTLCHNNRSILPPCRLRGRRSLGGVSTVRLSPPCAPAAVLTPQGPADIGPPPDLPSLLLANRIIYIGMPIVPSVTELVIAQLLYLNHRNPDQMITLYINSIGTNAPDGKAHYDTEAFAIADTMLFIRPPIRTICVGQAHGTAAMLLALGSKGQRLALPNASILLNQPRTAAQGLSKEVVIRAKEVAANRATTIELLASATGRDVDSVEKDTNRMRYLSPEEAVTYGLIDRVLYPEVIKNKLPDEDEGYVSPAIALYRCICLS